MFKPGTAPRRPNPQFLVDEAGVELGVAQQHFKVIKPWAKRRKLSHSLDLAAN